MFFFLCLLCLCVRLFICALWSPAGKGLTSWLTCVVSNFPIGILSQVWYLIVSIPDPCTITNLKEMILFSTGIYIISVESCVFQNTV